MEELKDSLDMPVVPRTAVRPRAAAPAAAPIWLARLAARLYQPALLLPTALAVAAIVTWPYLPAWAPDLSRDPAYQLTPSRLHLPAGHAWIPSDFADGVLARAGATPQRPLSLLREGLAERIARSLELDPWVEAVHRVQQQRDGTISVELQFRRPVLMVATSRGMYAVDAAGVLLPPESFRAEDVARFPLARQAQSLPSVGAGQVWNDAGVRGAARLAAVLAPHGDDSDPWKSLALTAILIPPATAGDSRLTYELQTTGGSRIIWGHAPDPDSLEPPAEQKLARLIYYREQCGGFEAAHGPTRIDIRGIDVIYAGALKVGAPNAGRR